MTTNPAITVAAGVIVPVPAAIVAFAERLLADVQGPDRVVDSLNGDTTITIGHAGGRRWRVTASNTRALMWVEYHVLSRNRLQWAQSELHIDGQQVDRAAGYPQFLNVFTGHDPDHRQVPDVAVDPVDRAAAPPKVRKTYDMILRKAPDADVAILRSGLRWAVVVNRPDKNMEIRFNFLTDLMDPEHPTRPVDTRPETGCRIGLVVDGVDRTAELNGQAERALAMLTGGYILPAAPAPPPVPGVAPARVPTTGVTTRKQKVMRI